MISYDHSKTTATRPRGRCTSGLFQHSQDKFPTLLASAFAVCRAHRVPTTRHLPWEDTMSARLFEGRKEATPAFALTALAAALYAASAVANQWSYPTDPGRIAISPGDLA